MKRQTSIKSSGEKAMNESRAERTFLARGEKLARRFELLADGIRHELARKDSAVERTGCIISAVQGAIGGMMIQTLMKRAVLADMEQNDE